MANEMMDRARHAKPMKRPPLVRVQQQQNFSILNQKSLEDFRIIFCFSLFFSPNYHWNARRVKKIIFYSINYSDSTAPGVIFRDFFFIHPTHIEAILAVGERLGNFAEY